MLDKLITGLKTYWIPILMGFVVIGMVVYMGNQNNDIDKLEADIATMQELIDDANATYAKISKEFDPEQEQKRIEQRTVSAKKIGKEMIAVDNALTSYYKMSEPLPEDEEKKKALFDKLEKAKAKNTKLTGAEEGDHISTWQLNPEWTLKLESVVVYQDTNQIPVVFSMKTKDGKNAGLIYATYDVNDHMLDNISRHYTTVGLDDAVDVGGI